ncbi:dTDP-4-keto-6-deoxy-D-glucose epimerase [Nonomuraea sp. PA05]|uniref:dTDP-4-dehydrorhamnose 3,5-epimerase family protein n=1 Tax=Nonomuraea sp. PA05 TaxID=2604466 RepID=UPI0011D3F287|nr:dTDP-4-dehydrorhamnose 3,5-epimerase family protein [Nonomuraea sp. PA05]TYB60565.1 dTDP-4-keto-6-deoxy-D-glucose epimerase [Nonomuraea sp. PA05]
MQIEPLGIDGAFLIKPEIFPDHRGEFLEVFSEPAFAEAVGHPLKVAQVNCSRSLRGTIRGIHAFGLPPGQSRYITCPQGEIVDIVVDIRVGSPTFGEWQAVRLNDRDRHALYLAEGHGHAFAPVTDEATVVYLVSSTYAPRKEILIDPLDPDLALPWQDADQRRLSDKDSKAPSLSEALKSGILPDYAECRARQEELRREAAALAGRPA